MDIILGSSGSSNNSAASDVKISGVHPLTTKSKAKKRSFTLEFKLNVIKCAESKSNAYAAEKYNVLRTAIIKWRKDKDKIETSIRSENGHKKKRIVGAGKKLMSMDMEQELAEDVVSQRSRGMAVSRSSIQRKARQLFPTMDDTVGSEFKGSSGWVQRFMLRNNFSLRRRTTIGQKDPEQLLEKIVSFITYVSRLRSKCQVLDGDITAMDETPIFMDMPAKTTVDSKGVKTVTVKTTGHEKDHVTTVLSARGDGTKLKPYIVFKKAKREVKAMENHPTAFVVSNEKGWMDDSLTKDWVNKVVVGSTFLNSDREKLIVWDSARPHISKSTKEHLVNLKWKSAVIPGGCTKYIQAPDVSWNAPFKSFVEEKYNDWMKVEENMSYTKRGNLRPPPRRLVVDWITAAWDTVSTDVILRSFKTCALTKNPDGSEDDQIHCLKEGQPCRGAWQILQDYRDDPSEHQISLAVDDDDNDDMFLIDESDED